MDNIDSEIITAVIALLGVIISALITRDNLSRDLDKRMSILDSKLLDMSNDIKEHNHYSKLYAETMPVVQEQMKMVNKRLEKLETWERNSNERSIH